MLSTLLLTRQLLQLALVVTGQQHQAEGQVRDGGIGAGAQGDAVVLEQVERRGEVHCAVVAVHSLLPQGTASGLAGPPQGQPRPALLFPVDAALEGRQVEAVTGDQDGAISDLDGALLVSEIHGHSFDAPAWNGRKKRRSCECKGFLGNRLV